MCVWVFIYQQQHKLRRKYRPFNGARGREMKCYENSYGAAFKQEDSFLREKKKISKANISYYHEKKRKSREREKKERKKCWEE